MWSVGENSARGLRAGEWGRNVKESNSGQVSVWLNGSAQDTIPLVAISGLMGGSHASYRKGMFRLSPRKRDPSCRVIIICNSFSKFLRKNLEKDIASLSRTAFLFWRFLHQL